MSHEIHAHQERRLTLLAEAERERLARQATVARPAGRRGGPLRRALARATRRSAEREQERGRRERERGGGLLARAGRRRAEV
ncbi:hypothetical protein SAMN06297387_12228 [Streptomyces zhaozhouensis]|uniref:Uncharacterized protein n=1 Tax=Streptomyces zhaozhouensis TaxID=1300267 RepID=A0A286E3K8_9ACTN|nr:hypothetical protein [Streptomyces zhaozhouensis]SOD65490.1 hypothetical protein SAMN06297387_12228 [Streptomyces zhaozhouensis]